jgi:cob(I)alamin adenosyltransferase
LAQTDADWIMRLLLALLLVTGCSKHSKEELGQAADEANHAAHVAAHAVASSAGDDIDELSRKLHEIEGEISDKTSSLGKTTDEGARKTTSESIAALERERAEVEAKLAAARAAHAGSGGSSGSAAGSGSP